MRRTLFVLAACGAPTTIAKPPPVIDTYCPDLHLGAWSSELFPACAPSPFDDWRLPLCSACAKPCAEVYASFDFGSIPEPIATFQYDAQGRWIGSTLAGTQIAARYDGGLVEIRESNAVDTATRDASGRITKLVRDSDEMIVTWGPDGVTAVGSHAIHYAAHVISGVDDASVTRDATGRATGDGTRTFAYDDRGRIIRRDEADRSLEIHRDDSERVDDVVEHHDADNGHTLFAYTCN